MRPEFRSDMQEYGDLAKKELEEKRRQEENDLESAPPESGIRRVASEARQEADLMEEAKSADAFREELGLLLSEMARKAGTSVETQRHIYEKQMRKQEIMERLRQDLRDLDDATSIERRADYTIVMRKGELRYKNAKGREVLITMGDLLTDGEWGLEYNFDRNTVPRTVRKRYVVHRAKRELEGLLDDQIIEERGKSEHSDQGLQDVYARVVESRGSGREQFGMIAEKIVADLAFKMTVDRTDEFKFEKADAFLDIERATDFILRRTDRARGVKVEANGRVLEDKGVQVTVNSNPEKLKRKQANINRSKRQLRPEDRLDDIVMARVDDEIIGDAYDRWKKSPTPGGPEKLLPEAFRVKLFAELTKGMGGSGIEDAPASEKRKAA